MSQSRENRTPNQTLHELTAEIIALRSRAEAAEAENEANAAFAVRQTEHCSELMEKNKRLQAEVARLGEREKAITLALGRHPEAEPIDTVELAAWVAGLLNDSIKNRSGDADEMKSLRTRIAELEAGLRNVLPHIKCRCDSTERSHNQIYWDTQDLLGGKGK